MFSRVFRLQLPLGLVISIFYLEIVNNITESVKTTNTTTTKIKEVNTTEDGHVITVNTIVEETQIEDKIGMTVMSENFTNSFKDTTVETNITTSSNNNIKKDLKPINKIQSHCVANSDVIQNLKLPGKKPFAVRCILKEAGKCPWAVILERKSPQDNFDLGWQDYRDGFGSPTFDGAYFVGLENLFALTQYQKQDLFISKRFETEDLARERYADFIIADERRYYKVLNLTVVSNETMVRHLLSGSEFSTKDRCYDEQLAVCSKTAGMGWWYSSRCVQSTRWRSVRAYVKAPTIIAVRPEPCVGP